MNHSKIITLAAALTLSSLSANAGTVTQEITFNLKTVTALSFTGDFAFNMDDLVGGDTILTTEDITLNYDNGDGSTPTAGGTRTVTCTVSTDNGSSYNNADADGGGSLQTVTLISDDANADTQILNLDFTSNCGDGTGSSQVNTMTITGTMNSSPDDNATYSSSGNNSVHIKAAYVAKSGISLNDDLGE